MKKHKLLNISKLIFLTFVLFTLTGCNKKISPDGPNTENKDNQEENDTSTVTLEKSTYEVGEYITFNFNDNKSLDDYLVSFAYEDNAIKIINNKYLAVKACDTALIFENKTNSDDVLWLDITISERKNPYENININLNKDHFVVGENVDYEITNYNDLDLFNITFDSDAAFKLNNDKSIVCRRNGEYQVTFSLISDPSVSTSITVDVYQKSFELIATTDTITSGDKIELSILSFEDIYEKSLDDFKFTVSNEKFASVEGNILTGNNPGIVTVTCTSLINPLVTKTMDIKVGNVTDTYMIRCNNYLGRVKVGEICGMTLTVNYEPENFIWSTSNKDILRVTRYEDKLEITGISEGEAIITCFSPTDASLKRTYKITVTGKEDVDYISRFIRRAFDEVGTKEVGVNHQKYGVWYGNDGEPWCATFVSWCWYHAGLSNDILLKYQGCFTGMEWCIEKGIFYYKEDYHPKSGDIVFFLSAGMSHTGIVAYSDSTYIYTIEGNSSDKVGIWRWKLDDAHITGYGVPKYPAYDTPEDFKWISIDKKDDGTYLWTDHNTGTSVL